MLNNPILVQKVDFDKKKVEGSNPNVSIFCKKSCGFKSQCEQFLAKLQILTHKAKGPKTITFSTY